jgi:ADP-heptose:LPS heptosyltransferase
MGWGDELIAAGEARKARQETGRRVMIAGGMHPEHTKVWDYCPDVDQKSDYKIFVGHGHRPYISANHKWKRYRPTPARIELTQDLKDWGSQFGQGFVIIEPNVKLGSSKANKDWGVANYQQVVDNLPQYKFVQYSYPNARKLFNVMNIPTPSFIHGLALMERAAGYLGPEGGLHHAAAAFGKPAVVIFGGFISPQVTGYDMHCNIFTGTGLGCASRVKCQCNCLTSISPGQVIEAVSKTIPLDQAAHPAEHQGG